MADEMDIEILDDGTIKIKTSSISEANHMTADEFMTEVTQLMGGTRTTEQLEHEFWKTRAVVREHGKIKIRGKA